MGAATRNRCLVLGSEHICHQPGRQSICDLRVCVWFVPRPSPVPSFHPTSQVPNPIMLICCKFFCSHHTGDIAPTASCSQRRTQVPAAWTCSNRCASTDPLLPGQSLEWEITKGHCEWKHAKGGRAPSSPAAVPLQVWLSHPSQGKRDPHGRRLGQPSLAGITVPSGTVCMRCCSVPTSGAEGRVQGHPIVTQELRSSVVGQAGTPRSW